MLNRLAGLVFDTTGSTRRGFFRDLFRPFVDGGPFPVEAHRRSASPCSRCFSVVVRIVSMIWALVRLYDFRLTRVGEDLRSEYGLFTKVDGHGPDPPRAGDHDQCGSAASVAGARHGSSGDGRRRREEEPAGRERARMARAADPTKRRCRTCCSRSCRASICPPSTGSRCIPAPSRAR